MRFKPILVDGVVPTELDDTNLRDDLWSFALDQRAFGPRKLLVAFADTDGTFRGLAWTDRSPDLESAFDACLHYLGYGAAVAVAYCDEPVAPGPPPPALADRFETMRSIAAARGIWLYDWIACDDDLFRSTATDAAVPGDGRAFGTSL